MEEISKKAQSFVSLCVLIFSTSAGANFGQECGEVGNYIYDHAGQVHNSLYVKYNGLGERKSATFEKRYRSLAWQANYDVGYSIEERSEYYKEHFQANSNSADLAL